LAPYGDKARSHPDGIIDLSVGTPVDDTPAFIQQALIDSANSPKYPVTVGTPELRAAMRQWAINILGAQGDFDVLPTIGSKELVALLPTLLQSKKVLYPTIAYPTYLVGAEIAGATSQAVELAAADWPKADLVWVNSPSNPTGQVQSEAQLRAVIEYSRTSGAVIASDECYINFPAGDVQPISILKVAAGNNTGLLAVHSLSKRSNFAGYRGGMIIGDPELIATILEVRKHAGLMVPLPVQKAMTVALGDETHVHEQAARYRARRAIMRDALEAAGFTIEHTTAGLYIWATRNEDGWDSVDWLAGLGILATPGSVYGSAGQNYIRVALTSTDAEIARASERIKGAL
jgi:aspartate/methionine/tyrosine aminotransferase